MACFEESESNRERLRDRFAMAWMRRLADDEKTQVANSPYRVRGRDAAIAEEAYRMADAMLVARGMK